MVQTSCQDALGNWFGVQEAPWPLRPSVWSVFQQSPPEMAGQAKEKLAMLCEMKPNIESSPRVASKRILAHITNFAEKALLQNLWQLATTALHVDRAPRHHVESTLAQY